MKRLVFPGSAEIASDVTRPTPGIVAIRALALIGQAAAYRASHHGPIRASGGTILIVRGDLDVDRVTCDAGTATHTAKTIADVTDLVERQMNRDGDREPTDDGVFGGDPRAVELLEKIHDQLERSHRRDRQLDFSVLRLFGALLQMFAIVAAAWGLTALFGDRATMATARLTLACFLQLASFSAFAIDRFR